MFVCHTSPEKTAKKIPHDLRFTVMADCIRIGNKAARQWEASDRGAVQFNFF